MCGKGGDKTTTVKNEIPPEVKAQYAYLMNRANTVAETPYEAYTGQRVAGLVPAQYDAMNMMQSAAANAQTPMSWSPQALQSYMNPYTQNVIDSTLANTNIADQLQQQQIVGSAIKQGNAFGGDRMGLAQAELARNQGLARNQTIAGLWNQNWNQANDNFARQQQYDLQSNESAAKLATQYLGAGTLAQQNQQKELDALYEAYQNRIAYPYQQLGWLGNLSLGVGSSSGGTSTKTESGGSGLGQIFGAGLGLASMFMSDKDAKENERQIGETFDGQPIYAYNYKGDPRTQIGLIAQEVEESHPEAVGEMGGGLLGVNYDLATADSAAMAPIRRAPGGAIPGLGLGSAGLIPLLQITAGGRGNMPDAGSSQSAPKNDPSILQTAQAARGFADRVRSAMPGLGQSSAQPMDIRPEVQATQPLDPAANAAPSLGSGEVLSALGGLFASGGAVGGGLMGSGMRAGGGFGSTQWGAMAPNAAGNTALTQGNPWAGAGTQWGAGQSPVLSYLKNYASNTGTQLPFLPAMEVSGHQPPMPPPATLPTPTSAQNGTTTTVGSPSLWSNMYSWTTPAPSMSTGYTGPVNPWASTGAPNWSTIGNARPGDPNAAGTDADRPWGYASGGAVEELPLPDTAALDMSPGAITPLPSLTMPPREMLERPAPVSERTVEKLPPPVEVNTPPQPRTSVPAVRGRTPIADTSQPAHWQAFLHTIGGPESGDRYNVRFDGTPTGATFDDYSRHPAIPVTIPTGRGFTRPGERSTAAGRYQFTDSTWRTLPAEIQNAGFSPENQDRAARWLATERYRLHTGRDLDTDLQQHGLTPGMVRVLAPTWEALGRARPETFVSAYAQAQGAPAAGASEPAASRAATQTAAAATPRAPDRLEGGAGPRPNETRLPRFGQEILDRMGISLSDNARLGLLAAGLGMMSSRSRNPATAIGEGGLAGINAYRAAEEASRTGRLTEAQIGDLTSHSRQRDADTALKQRQLALQEQAAGQFDRIFGSPAVGAPSAGGAGGAAPVPTPAPSAAAPPSAAVAPAGASSPQPPAQGAPAALNSPAVQQTLAANDIDPQWDPRLLATAARVMSTRGLEPQARWAQGQIDTIMKTGIVYDRQGRAISLPGYNEQQAALRRGTRQAEREVEIDTAPRIDPDTHTVIQASPSERPTRPAAPAAPAVAPAPPPGAPSSAPPAPDSGVAATPVAPPALETPAAARLAPRASVEERTGRVATVVPAVPAGTAGGYARPNLQPGEYISAPSAAETERRKGEVAVEAEVAEKARASGTVSQQLREIAQGFKLFSSNVVSDRLMGASQIAAALGQNQVSQRFLQGAARGDQAEAVAAAEWVEKNGNDLALNLLKAANSRFTQAEFITIANRGVPTRAMRPETAHNLIASQLGTMDSNQQMYSDWLKAQGQGWQSISAFADAWKKENPIQTFIDAAQRRIGNFRGMPLPPIDRWVEGATYVAPDRMPDNQRRVLADRGVQPGQTFRYLGNGRLQLVRPDESFSAQNTR